MSEDEKKEVEFLGDSLNRLRQFPDDERSAAGHQIDRVQSGKMPDDYSYMGTIGQGTYEIRINGTDGIYRVFYVASKGDAVYVLHCFQKKTEQTSPKDIATGKRRYKEIP